ncbi:hypothetical protein FB451DRAFT_1260301 [Mycena latifolia]|nr:hypothetical protein FB451DRAFT_1260301 [Mycena latifolia]
MPAVPQQHWPLPVQQPTCTNLRIRSVEDAHKIFYGVRKGLLRMVTRRLDVDERATLRTGCVYAWEERSPNTEITGVGIERFTEGRRWSASRVRDEFLFYYEKFVPDPNQPHSTATGGSAPEGWDQLVKQTYSVWVDTGRGRKKWHLTAYFTQKTVDGLGTVDDIEDVRKLDVPAGMFTSTRVGKRKHAEVEAASQPAVTRVYAPFPSPLPPLAPRPAKPGRSTSTIRRAPSPSVKMYDPYSRPSSQVPQPQSPAPYYGPAASQSYPPPSPPASHPPTLHYLYTPNVYSPPTQHNYTRQDDESYSRSDPAPLEHPSAPTSVQPYSPPYISGIFSNDRMRLPTPTPYPPASTYPNPQPQHPHPQPQQPSGGWYTSPMVPYQPRQDSPRSDFTSSPSSSSSYQSSSSPAVPSYPPVQLYSPEPTIFAPLSGGGSNTRSLPRITPDPLPAILLSPTSSQRRGEIGPSRDLPPLNSLRAHPYRRNPTDDEALRLLGPRPTP